MARTLPPAVVAAALGLAPLLASGCGDVAPHLVESAPLAYVLWPSEGEAIEGPISLLGQVVDDVTPAGDLVAWWESDVDGPLGQVAPDPGTGRVLLEGANLRCGRHAVSLRAVDAAGLAAVDTRVLSVGPGPLLISIEAPASTGEILYAGDGDALVGQVSGAPEGVELEVLWASDLDGVLYSGPPDGSGTSYLVPSLSPGLHALVLEAEARCEGAISTASARVTVEVRLPDADGDGSRVDLGDCDDGDPAVHPGAAEVCNLVDDDCDGEADEGLDQDGDGLAPCAGDCDDTDALVGRGAVEICDNHRDDDCDAAGSPCRPTGSRGLVDAGARLIGESAGDLAGFAVAPVGDVDGDGWQDLAIGAPGHDGGRGAVFVVFGPVHGLIDLSAAARWRGDDVAGEAGAGVGPAGDLDGDGYDDLVVGAPGAAGDAGALVLLRGPDLVPLGTWVGSAPGDRLGQAVASNGPSGAAAEGWMAGAPGAGTGAGVAYVLYALPSGDCPAVMGEDLAACAGGLVLSGVEPGQGVGLALGTAGDLDGDGWSEPWIASPGHPGGAGAGALDLLRGPAGTGSALLGCADLDGGGVADDCGFDARLVGVEEGDAAAIDGDAPVAAGGDLDGDGHGDLVVGAPGLGDGADEARGGASVLYGPISWEEASLAVGAARLLGEPGHRAGRSLAVAGDFDADGFDDVAVGAPGADAGAVHLIYGGAGRLAGDLSLATATGATWLGEATGDAAGHAVAAAGDLDGDGYADLLVGAPGSDAGGPDAGIAYVLAGQGE